MKRIFQILIISALFTCCSSTSKKNETPLKIWFNQPALKWKEGFPIGNGSLGGMIYGTPKKETICLNEETIWTGKKLYSRDKKEGYKSLTKLRKLLFDGKYIEAEKLVGKKLLTKRFPTGTFTYQMLAKLFIERPGFDNVTNYKRELDLNNSVVNTLFEKDGIKYNTKYFSSFPDKVIVIKYTADKKKSINFLASIKRSENTKIDLTDNCIHFSEQLGNGIGVKFHSFVNFEVKGGKSYIDNGKIVISKANEVIIRIVAASNYRGGNPEQICMQNLKRSLSLSYNKLLKKHINDYRSLFTRLDIQLSNNNGDDLPTDKRLEKVKNGIADNYLTELEYQFGRYLLISSSRPGTLPTNLQGIWVEGFRPPWNADYHININIQMNYWLAEKTNLSECHLPFLDFIGDLREMGRITAKETYGCRGFVAHHTSDAWHMTAGFGRARYGMWPMGAAWCCEHIYSHYAFTEDKEYLKNYAYPILKEASQFFVDFLVPDPETGLLVSGPSVSPENSFYDRNGKMATISMGPTMDKEIIFELFNNCISASKILNIDKDFRDTLQNKIAQMSPIKIGKDGRIMEWDKDFKEYEPGHRHISHLYALFPSNQISKTNTPKLFEAAKKTIEYRLSHGGGQTGWSRAWIINFWARLLEPEKAYQNVLAFQKKSILPNLIDENPVVQLDGNFGIVSGITEMLMQSQDNEVNILPALPQEWATGSIRGLLARKGFQVDIKWKNNKLEYLTIHSKLGNTLKLHYGNIFKNLDTKKGEVLSFNGNLEQI